MTVRPAETGQPGHPPNLIRVFAVRMKKAWVLSYPLSAQRRLWSNWADAQADLSLRWAHSHFVGFVMSWLKCRECHNHKPQPTPSIKRKRKRTKIDAYKMSLDTRILVFWVCDQVRLKRACAATEASWSLELSDIETRYIMLSRQWTTKALIRLRGCACWSAPLLFANGINRFSHDVAQINKQMNEKHIDNLSLPQARWSQCKTD